MAQTVIEYIWVGLMLNNSIAISLKITIFYICLKVYNEFRPGHQWTRFASGVITQSVTILAIIAHEVTTGGEATVLLHPKQLPPNYRCPNPYW